VLSDPSTQQAVEHILSRGTAVFAADLITSTNPLARGGKYAGFNFSGYYFGYNAPDLSYQVMDLINLIMDAHLNGVQPGVGKVRSVYLLATGSRGPAAIIANGVAVGAVDRAAIDLNHFDFDQVHDPADEMMLPGALKYGGVAAFASMCTHGKTMIWNAPATWKKNSLVATPQVSLREGEAKLDDMIDSLLQ